MDIIIEIFRSFARAHRASVFAKQGNYQKSRDIMSREYEVHP